MTYFEIFQCSVPTYLLLLEFNVCGHYTLSDTDDNFTLPSMPLHGNLCDFLQKITEKPKSALNVDRECISFAIFILSCISICKKLNFLQIRDYLHNNKTLAHHAKDHLIWNKL